jgi:hypothetical protein
MEKGSIDIWHHPTIISMNARMKKRLSSLMTAFNNMDMKCVFERGTKLSGRPPPPTTTITTNHHSQAVSLGQHCYHQQIIDYYCLTLLAD